MAQYLLRWALGAANGCLYYVPSTAIPFSRQMVPSNRHNLARGDVLSSLAPLHAFKSQSFAHEYNGRLPCCYIYAYLYIILLQEIYKVRKTLYNNTHTMQSS